MLHILTAHELLHCAKKKTWKTPFFTFLISLRPWTEFISSCTWSRISCCNMWHLILFCKTVSSKLGFFLLFFKVGFLVLWCFFASFWVGFFSGVVALGFGGFLGMALVFLGGFLVFVLFFVFFYFLDLFNLWKCLKMGTVGRQSQCHFADTMCCEFCDFRHLGLFLWGTEH